MGSAIVENLVKKAFGQNGIVIPYQTITISNRS